MAAFEAASLSGKQLERGKESQDYMGRMQACIYIR